MPIVIIDWLEGRDEDQKRAVAKGVTEAIVNSAKCAPEAVTIVFNDHPRSHIAKAGVLFSDT
jgi:4-oxalocrotonate tautomerase